MGGLPGFSEGWIEKDALKRALESQRERARSQNSTSMAPGKQYDRFTGRIVSCFKA